MVMACVAACGGPAESRDAEADIGDTSGPNADSMPSTSSLYLRLRNETGLDFDSVTVEQRVEYGSLAAGEDSEYLPMDYLFDTLLVVGESGDSTVMYAPIDQLGDRELSSGHYTYVLTLHDDLQWFRIMLLRDAAPE